ncbi:hypothetical protein [Sphingomonas sp.]|uniref:hypothetical protein n=1 Tax=Sphingomonas sp. TaxID=28214 RepID=UPI0031D2EF5D
MHIATPQVAASARSHAAERGVGVQRAMDAMRGIERTSSEIAEIIGSYPEIGMSLLSIPQTI